MQYLLVSALNKPQLHLEYNKTMNVTDCTYFIPNCEEDYKQGNWQIIISQHNFFKQYIIKTAYNYYSLDQ